MSYNVAIVGATELIGQEMIKVLAGRKFPVSSLKLLGTATSIGKGRTVSFGGQDVVIQEITSRALRDVDFTFFCGETETTQHFINAATDNQNFVIDVSGAFRGDDKVLAVVAGINNEELVSLKKKRIVTSPSAAVIQLMLPLNILRGWSEIKRVIVNSFEPVSESGQTAMEQLGSEARQVLEGRNVVPHAYNHQIAFNLLPETDNFLDTGLTRSEWRIIREVKRIWRLPNLNFSITCIRVPLFIGMSQSVQVDIGRRITPDEFREVVGDTPGVRIADEPSVGLYPQPWQVMHQDDIVVGRVRELDPTYNTLGFWSVMDNLRRGAAVNAALIAESAIEQKLV